MQQTKTPNHVGFTQDESATAQMPAHLAAQMRILTSTATPTMANSRVRTFIYCMTIIFNLMKRECTVLYTSDCLGFEPINLQFRHLMLRKRN